MASNLASRPSSEPAVAAAAAPAPAPAAQWEPVIVGFLCNWCSYAGADTAGTIPALSSLLLDHLNVQTARPLRGPGQSEPLSQVHQQVGFFAREEQRVCGGQGPLFREETHS